ncbi:toxin [Salmonella enterica subsp. enterica]|uniref:Cytolethal distending toxin subunit A n=1 Tax=Salmonella enterica subsp. enterica serovar Aqua TaxID=1302615 RepID=A0A5X6ET24_SALET|nr:toxin [Salmonella enterica subsp. enterica serovar Aqua]ECC9721831.1 toxin [Salmonella enterica subsp. diarizonae]ECH1172655.1 toxin [Salmonella enterica subsp. enterica serovar Aqua]EJM2521918.1 toxin [Salmonella enterica]HCM8928444.1 toxin [Salmonella enterica subsp. enterica serovar Paratyphi B]
MTNKYKWIILILFLTGCSSSPPSVDSDGLHKIFPLPSGNGPVPPDPRESGLPLPGYGATTELPPGANAPLPNPGDNPSVSIMSMSGAVLTVWGRSRNSWLWGYTPRDSNNFGELRNWKIIPGKTPGTVRFVNQETGTCMTWGVGISGAGGFIHTTCDPRSAVFDFHLIPTLNGNVFIQSVDLRRCIRARFLDRTSASPYAFEILQADCPKPGESNIELQWSISEPLRPALAAISKPEIRPAPPIFDSETDNVSLITDPPSSDTHFQPISYQN